MTTYCSECRSLQRYEVDGAGEWFCKACGFAIDCTDCGQTMYAGHGH